MHRVPKLLAFALLALSIAGSQEKPAEKAQTPETFKARTELVLVPVVVTKGNQPVRGLNKDNFVVEEDGKARSITVFDAVTPADEKKHKAPEPNAPEVSNIDSGSVPQAMTLIAIDGINTPVMSQEQARRQVLGFVARNATPGQLLGVVVLTDKGVKLVQDFTTNPRLLVAALEKVTGQANRFAAGLPAGTERQNVQPISSGSPNTPVIVKDTYEEGLSTNDPSFQRMQDQFTAFVHAEAKVQEFNLASVVNASLDAFQQIAQGLAGYPGKKNVIWASAGFVYPLDMERFKDQRYIMDKYIRTMRMLADANVAVYPVDVHGIQIQAGADATYTREDSWAGVDKYSSYKAAGLRIDTFRDFAERTGGKVFFDPTSNQKAFEQVMAETQSYYMLGYYLDKSTVQNGWHKLKVKLRGADGSVQSRTGFFVVPPPSDPEQIKKADLSIAARAPFDYTGLAIKAAWGQQVPDGSKKKVPFELRLLPGSHLLDADQTSIDFDFVAIARKPTSEVAGQSSKSVSVKLQPKAAEMITTEGITYKGVLQLEPGTYEVRFLVRDNFNGRMGSVLATLKVD